MGRLDQFKMAHRNNKWSSCPDGHYLSGIFKTGADQWLHNIEEGKCCKPKGHPQSWGQCYDEDVTLSFDNRGWSGCNTDFYLVGLYRSVCNRLYCIETFKCCKMAERKYQRLIVTCTNMLPIHIGPPPPRGALCFLTLSQSPSGVFCFKRG